jgi:hypothetical protein
MMITAKYASQHSIEKVAEKGTPRSSWQMEKKCQASLPKMVWPMENRAGRMYALCVHFRGEMENGEADDVP